jgi:choline dehydrogenase-like flavoprotein
MMRLPPVDVLVVGAGMAGGAVTCTLAEAGVRVTCLEQGRRVPHHERPHTSRFYEVDRAFSWSTAPNVRGWASDYPVSSDTIQPLMFNAVGGSTAIYTAAWPRFRPSDFRKHDEHGMSPNWPLTYEDLAPWFAENDRSMGVSGLAGDPAMPPHDDYPNPPLPLGRGGERFAHACDALGWHWWPFPMAVASRDYRGRPACNGCGACQSGCNRDSLAGSHNTYWPRALTAGAELRTGSRVERILTDGRGSVTGVVYVRSDTGLRYEQPAGTVVVACNGIGTPRLLLMSASDEYPGGLANSSDQVGRNLMFHGLSIVEGWTRDVLEPHKGVICASAYTAEFAETDTGRGFVNGFTLLACGMNGPGYQAIGSHSGNVAPWGANHHAWFEEHFDRGMCILVQSEDLPHPENRVTLDPARVDSDGLPAAHVRYRLHPNDDALLAFACERAVELLRRAGAVDVKVNRFLDASGTYRPPAWHLMGTARMGDDPTTSVVDPEHRAWDVRNLYVCDGSSLPTGGAVNPTSTIGAVALRCGDSIRRHLGG